jgi:hypothetical protein
LPSLALSGPLWPYLALTCREFVKNSEKDSNCENFAEMVESNHNFGSTIYFVTMTVTSSGDKYILHSCIVMIIVLTLKERKNENGFITDLFFKGIFNSHPLLTNGQTSHPDLLHGFIPVSCLFFLMEGGGT